MARAAAARTTGSGDFSLSYAIATARGAFSVVSVSSTAGVTR